MASLQPRGATEVQEATKVIPMDGGTKSTGEIEESTSPDRDATVAAANESTPLLTKPHRSKSVRTKVPEIEVHLYRQGKGPIDVFKSCLGGWDQDQLEVRDILDKYGFKSIYAFNSGIGRGVPIRFNPRNGRSVLPYKDGSVISVDGEPKDSILNPITKIIVGVVITTVMIVFVMKETPEWMEKLNVSGFKVSPWVLACAVIVFTRMRKRTKDFLKDRGW